MSVLGEAATCSNSEVLFPSPTTHSHSSSSHWPRAEPTPLSSQDKSKIKFWQVVENDNITQPIAGFFLTYPTYTPSTNRAEPPQNIIPIVISQVPT